MKINRRELFRSAVASSAVSSVAVAAAASAGSPDWSKVREDFPWLKEKLWLTAADYHPIGIHSLRAMEKYLASRVHGPGGDHPVYSGQQEPETKELFARLINARASEIAFVQSTTDAENIVVAGMDLAQKKGNVVIDDLNYQASKYLYHMLQKEGDVELRVIHHRSGPAWTVDIKDVERAVDRNTLLVSMAVVSNINGYLHDAKAISEVAHAHGAYFYGDIIQGAGAIPIDVRAMGIDFAGCGAYKWLMSDMGFGFLYVREDLQDSVVKRSRYGVNQYKNPNHAQADSKFDLLPGAVRYETGSFSNVGCVSTHAALKYIHSLGIENIRMHAKSMTDRLQKELPAMGYPGITPKDNRTPIVSFLLPEYEKTAAMLKKAFGEIPIALRRWEFTNSADDVSIIRGMRISPSVYNNQGDIDRLLNALS